MTLEDIQFIESELKLTIPKPCRDILLNLPFPKDSWGDAKVCKTKEEIIKSTTNRDEVEDMPKPVMIGWDDTGSFFFDANDAATPIYILDFDGTWQTAFDNWDEFRIFMSAPAGEFPDELLSPEQRREKAEQEERQARALYELARKRIKLPGEEALG